MAKTDGVQLYYERRNKQYSSVSTINRYQIVNLRVLTQSFVATFLQQPYKAHRHESILLKAFAETDSQRTIYCDTHSQYPYYIAALIWYRFEEAFRKNILKKNDRTYLAHMYFIMTFMSGQYPLANFKSKDATNKYCEKLELILNSPDIDKLILQSKAVLIKCAKEWENAGNNRYVMKENKEFTDLLTKISRNTFIGKQTSIDLPSNIDNSFEDWREGVIFSFVNSNPWYAFIKSSECCENVYFDARNYSGSERFIIPKTKCRFILESKNKNGAIKLYAKKVELIDD